MKPIKSNLCCFNWKILLNMSLWVFLTSVMILKFYCLKKCFSTENMGTDYEVLWRLLCILDVERDLFFSNFVVIWVSLPHICEQLGFLMFPNDYWESAHVWTFFFINSANHFSSSCSLIADILIIRHKYAHQIINYIDNLTAFWDFMISHWQKMGKRKIQKGIWPLITY